MDDQTRVFFVTDSIEDNEEIFETLEEAEDYVATMPKTRSLDNIGDPNEPRLRVCLVRHAYQQEDGSWNYDDYSDTFEEAKTLTNDGTVNL